MKFTATFSAPSARVDLSKPGLSYNEMEGSFQNRIRDWVVQMPQLGFLFPAFNDRSTDLHSTLYYSKDSDDLHDAFIEQMLGCRCRFRPVTRRNPSRPSSRRPWGMPVTTRR